MSDNNWQKVETIVDQALELPEGKRETFVQERCEGNPKLKGEVTQLLESIFDSEGWLENPKEYKQDFYYEIADDIEELAPDHSLIGQQVGSYTIKKKIGEGGMGTIYQAERSGDDFAHQVAIKIIRSSKASRQNVQRFRREQHILAGLHHPNIAQLFDGGVTHDGTPYIIMEYVDGIPIDKYCKTNDCTLEHKIELFKAVLQAVRYAHENLVVHRDLKPGNILVDNNGNIKILDFGISKLLKDDESLELTQTGTRLLTPRYAAPEQVRQENITTATDMYALGVILYELLSGAYPFDFTELSQYEMEQAIVEKEPPKPSSKISDAPTLQKRLNSDLDAIALKALRKEPDRRYRVANELLEDLDNYQRGIPVSAREDSFRYRSGKFIRRHKQGLAAAVGVVVLIVGLVGFYTWRIAKERDQAHLEAQKAEEVSNFLLNLFEANNPSMNEGQELTAEKLLERGLNRSQKMQNDYVRADMLEVIGEAYGKLGFQHKSENIIDRSIKIHQSLYDKSSLEIASILYKRGVAENLNHDIALPYFKKSFKIYKSKPSERVLERAAVARELAVSYRHAGKLDSAEFFARKSLKLNRLHDKNEGSESILNSKTTLAYVLRKRNKLDKAKKLYLEVISKRKSETSKPSLSLATNYNNLAFIFRDEKNYDRAGQYLSKSLNITERILGSGHENTLMVRSNLAQIHNYAGDTKETEKLYRDNVRYAEKYYPSGHWKIGSKYGTLAFLLTKEGRYKEAEPLFRKSARIYKNSLGKKHIWTASEYSRLSINLFLQDKDEEAKKMFSNYYPFLEKKAPDFRKLNINQIKDLITLCKIDTTKLSEEISSYKKLIDIAQK
ncbi:serine/threonine protein kinase [Fodinibius salinus]|uniref:Serine/threonine protein kinase n=1 Tax=Fodinibius salinus TaxID=860790 RepID=A0A5D3YMC5_9BACT|nr:serine/threonine-protein kinase [Fodinibius salinus]TYP95305.1 serine/threonine protein kinase [Fodinibius salinus]